MADAYLLIPLLLFAELRQGSREELRGNENDSERTRPRLLHRGVSLGFPFVY